MILLPLERSSFPPVSGLYAKRTISWLQLHIYLKHENEVNKHSSQNIKVFI